MIEGKNIFDYKANKMDAILSEELERKWGTFKPGSADQYPVQTDPPP